MAGLLGGSILSTCAVFFMMRFTVLREYCRVQLGPGGHGRAGDAGRGQHAAHAQHPAGENRCPPLGVPHARYMCMLG